MYKRQDLRESGAIEQAADIVAFIHRPEYYGINQDENGMPTAGMAELIIAKHRNGAVTDVKLRFLKDQARFADIDDADLLPDVYKRQVIYGFVVTAVLGYTVDVIQAGNQQSSQIFVFTRRYEAMADQIIATTRHSATILDATGWYSNCLLYTSQDLEGAGAAQ